MSMKKITSKSHNDERLRAELCYLKLTSIQQNYISLADEAAGNQWSHIDYLDRLIEAEADLRRDRSIQRRIRLARFPVIKTLEQFQWSWPKKINRLEVQNLFRLHFIEEKANVIFLGNVGVGKTHLSTALGYQACLRNYSVLFCTAAEVINNLQKLR